MLGFKAGDIEVIASTERKDPRGNKQWIYKCKCGNEGLAITGNLLTGGKRSCGNCNYHIKHPLAYTSWSGMKDRCNNPNMPNYKNYGGRGILYDLSWEKFTNFLHDMGDPPVVFGVRTTLDRIDNDKGYSKENCKWSTYSEQLYNQRKNS